jgi:hypothetical protein
MGILSSINKWLHIANNVKPASQTIVTRTTIAIREAVQAEAPVLSGFLRDSVYSVTPDGVSTYGQASPPNDDVYLLPEEKPQDDLTGIVRAAANYSGFVNYGHHTRSGSMVPPNPFFDRGVAAAQGQFDANCTQFESLLKAGI